MRRRRTTVAGLLVGSLVGLTMGMPGPVGGAPSAAAVSLPQFGCFPAAGTVEPSGVFNDVVFNSASVTGPVLRDPISALGVTTALGSTVYVPTSGMNTFRTFAVRGGYLRLETTRYSNTNPAARTVTSRVLGRGWGIMTKIVDASDRASAYTKNGYLYAVAPATGTLARYRISEATFGSPTVVSAGVRTGYGSIRSLALAYRYREGSSGAADVLIATTSAGRLELIVVPIGAAFAPSVSVLRTSTWLFDDLFVNQCNTNGRYSLVGVRRSTQRAYLYRLDSIAGTSSVIRSYGQISGAWSSVRSSALWGVGSYPTRW